MNLLVMINEIGIVMSEGRYVATEEQLEQLVTMARKAATCSKGERAQSGGRRAYEYMIEHGCTQQEAADAVDVSQATLARYIKRHRLKVPDNRCRR